MLMAETAACGASWANAPGNGASMLVASNMPAMERYGFMMDQP